MHIEHLFAARPQEDQKAIYGKSPINLAQDSHTLPELGQCRLKRVSADRRMEQISP
ncbi:MULTISPECIES: hypothetical protein [Nonomuraea]|uniref:DUF5753 domain-containing protein n=1 Tax=Nonomuraea mangrovi TaxID=2316207 RepID=A0ABW4SWY3_9ACTN